MRNEAMDVSVNEDVGLRYARQPLHALLYFLHPYSRNSTYAADTIKVGRLGV